MRYLLTLIAVLFTSPVLAEPMLLQFTADWCPHCQTMKPRVALMDKEGYDIKTLDVDQERGKRFSKTFNITTIPASVVVDVVDGKFKVLGRKVGEMGAQELRVFLKKSRMVPRPKKGK